MVVRDALEGLHLIAVHLSLGSAALAHLKQVPHQPKTRHVRHRMDARHGRKLGANGVQGLHAAHGGIKVILVHFAPLLGCGDHPHPQRLGQEQHVAWMGCGILLQMFHRHAPSHGQPKNRFRTIDAVPPSQGDASLFANASAALQDLTRDLLIQLVDGPSEDGDGHKRRAPHGVDVADRVRRGDASKRVWVVDNGHEKVRRAHNRRAVAQIHHRRIVLGVVPDQQLRIMGAGLHARQHVVKHRRGNFAPTARAVGVLGQFDVA